MRRPEPLRFPLLVIPLIGLALVAAACGSDDSTGFGDIPTGDADGDPPHGTLALRVEEVDGVFVEGFEIGIRVENADGVAFLTTLWSEEVAEQGDGGVEAFYDTVAERSVPVGEIAVLATVNVGTGPPPAVPSLDGPMDCRLPLEVAAGERVEVEIDFSGTADCLREVGRQP